jgi:hypothetical protein
MSSAKKITAKSKTGKGEDGRRRARAKKQKKEERKGKKGRQAPKCYLLNENFPDFFDFAVKKFCGPGLV